MYWLMWSAMVAFRRNWAWQNSKIDSCKIKDDDFGFLLKNVFNPWKFQHIPIRFRNRNHAFSVAFQKCLLLFAIRCYVETRSFIGILNMFREKYGPVYKSSTLMKHRRLPSIAMFSCYWQWFCDWAGSGLFLFCWSQFHIHFLLFSFAVGP